MGNQQGKAEDKELAWLAGFVDGEGYIGIRERQDGSQKADAADTDLAWLSGFIDAEGTITLKHQAGERLRQMKKTYFQPCIKIVNTDMPTLGIITDILDAHGLPYHVQHRPARGNHSASWYIEVRGLKRCQRWLDALIPYLRTKRPQGQLMLDFIASRLSKHENTGYSDNEQAIIQSLRQMHARPGS